tara:strand:- start:11537 stop:12439 length:903 start_codon:yes stop_codon:yes gene_type:complete
MEDNDIQNPPDSNTNSSTKNFNLNPAGVDAAALAIQAVGQTIGGFVDIAQGFRAKRTASKAQDKANADLEKLMASQPSLSTPSEYYEAVKNAYDQRLLQMRNQDINRSFATTAQAAQQYGSRGLGAIMQAQQQAQSQLGEETMKQQQLQTAALTNLAAARQQETQLREARSTRDLEYGYDAKALADAQMAQARQQIGQGFAGAITGAATIGAGVIAKKKGLFKDGGEVYKTPGEFNHDTNEMYVVDEDGRDVGIALTGGEYVISPDDAREMRELSGKGKTPLHKFVSRMVRRFEKADNNG